MIKNKSFLCIVGVTISVLSCAYGIQGVKKMESSIIFLSPIEIVFHNPVLSIFPVSQLSSFGMISGKADEETLRIETIIGKHLKEFEIPRKSFEAGDEIGFCVKNCSEMYMSNIRILSWVNLKTKKNELDYWGVGKSLENTYQKTKLIDEDKKIVITVMAPFYNDSFTEILNGTSALGLDDLINKKRIKTLPISTESGECKTIDKSNIGRAPNVFFGPNYIVYRESPEYRWLTVNNNLDSITHPLQELLNQHAVFFKSQFLSIEIAPDQPYAVAVCQDTMADKRTVAIIQWNKAPSIMLVPLELKKKEEVHEKSMTLSPSGKWAYFSTRGGIKRNYFLMYVDTNLPNGCLPPFPLTIDTEMETKATWVTAPEGFVMKVEGKLLYWDLSKFSANTFLKTREYDFLQLEKNH